MTDNTGDGDDTDQQINIALQAAASMPSTAVTAVVQMTDGSLQTQKFDGGLPALQAFCATQPVLQIVSIH